MGEDQIINNNSPKYMQLREILRTHIEDGEYLPGTAIPSESELVDSFGIHRLTVRNAINALVMEGLLKPVQGKGVFVVGKKMQHDLETLSGFRQKTRAEGAQAGTKTLFRTVRPAGLKYARLLEIKPDDEIYYLRRLYYVDKEPASLEDIYLPKAILPDIQDIDLDVFSLFDILEFNGISVVKAWQTLAITRLDAKDSRWLKISPNTAVLLFECTSRDQYGRVIEFNRSYTRSDRACFTVSYQRLPQDDPTEKK